MFKHLLNKTHQEDVLHQISTPLTTVMLNLEDLYAGQNKKNHKLTQTIQQMNQVLNVLRTRDTQSDAITFCPSHLIDEFLSNYQKPYQVKCTFRTSKKGAIDFYGCPDAFREIVLHLLNNATEAYHANLAHREIFIDLMPAMSGLNLVIGDNGRGINWWQKPLIKSKGISFKTIKSGLGLYKVSSLARKKFGGTLKIISFSHRGTIVIVHFPLR